MLPLPPLPLILEPLHLPLPTRLPHLHLLWISSSDLWEMLPHPHDLLLQRDFPHQSCWVPKLDLVVFLYGSPPLPRSWGEVCLKGSHWVGDGLRTASPYTWNHSCLDQLSCAIHPVNSSSLLSHLLLVMFFSAAKMLLLEASFRDSPVNNGH